MARRIMGQAYLDTHLSPEDKERGFTYLFTCSFISSFIEFFSPFIYMYISLALLPTLGQLPLLLGLYVSVSLTCAEHDVFHV